MTRASADLDPEDWDAFRSDAHRALDGMIDHLRGARDRPVWREPPAAARARFRRRFPREGRQLAAVLDDFERHIQPYATGNTHPLFMGWVHGAGTPVGMVAEMLAAGLNANCGGRNHVAIDVERQVTSWVAEAFGFPETASGLCVTGTSMANFIAVLIAREHAIGARNVRCNGLGASGARLVAYASQEAHNCIRQAMEMSGLGARQLRLVASDAHRRMRLDELERQIASDRQSALQPFLIVGTAGTVDVGAIDDLSGMAEIARREGLWLHVDGAYGALAMLSPALKPLLAGLERADSVAFDFHKWIHVPYDAGFLIVRDAAAHLRAFAASEATYLSRAPRGLAAGETWPCDLGPDLSRGFRALKVWFTIEVFGADRLGACIERTCRMAQRLETAIKASSSFQMRAVVALNIVCFAPIEDPHGDLAREIVMDLHEAGTAAPSLTLLDGVPAIRAAIVNHRTRDEDIDAFVALLERAEIAARARIATASRTSA